MINRIIHFIVYTYCYTQISSRIPHIPFILWNTVMRFVETFYNENSAAAIHSKWFNNEGCIKYVDVLTYEIQTRNSK